MSTRPTILRSHSTPPRRRSLARWVRCGLAGGLVLFTWHDSPAVAQFSRSRPPASVPALSPAALSSPAPVRLYFYNATWEEVLTKVAEASGVAIVMDKVPAGRFTRLDRRQYQKSDAVKILNRELEPLGYRILEKPEHLVLLDLHELRSEYRRPLMPIAAEEEADDVDGRPSEGNSSRPIREPLPSTDRARPRTSGKPTIRQMNHEEEESGRVAEEAAARSTGKVWTPPRATRLDQADATHEVDSATPGRSVDVTLAPQPRKARTEPPARAAQSPADRPRELFDPPPAAKASPARSPAIVRKRVDVAHGEARELARAIYDGAKPHVELAPAGPDGLPSFSVHERVAGARGGMPAAEGRVDYAIAIDGEANALVIESTAERIAQIELLVGLMDSAPRPGRG